MTTPGWLTWYTKSDRYSREKLQQDLESLRSFYMNQGYLDFEIESASVSIGPDKQNIYISISVKEGERYTVSAVRFAGNGSAAQRVGTAIEIGGAALVMVLGLLLLGAALQA